MPLSLPDGTTILNVVKSAEPNIEACLIAIAKQKGALSKLSLQAAVHATLINLETSVQALINALIAAAPVRVLLVLYNNQNVHVTFLTGRTQV